MARLKCRKQSTVHTFHSFDSTRYIGTPLAECASTIVVAVLGWVGGCCRVVAVVQERILHFWVGHERRNAKRVCPGRLVRVHGRPDRTAYGDLRRGDECIADTRPANSRKSVVGDWEWKTTVNWYFSWSTQLAELVTSASLAEHLSASITRKQIS